MPSILITGANRGIGLEFARQYAAEGWAVHATCRNPDKAKDLNNIKGVMVHGLEVTDHPQIDALAAKLDAPFDIVIANAGVSGPRENNVQIFGSLDYDEWRNVFDVNVFAAVKTLEAFTPHLERGKHKKMVAISSKMGSIADTSGGSTLYRTSKTALNMAMTAAAADLAQRGIAVGVLHPGWVQTDMGGPSAMITPSQSVAGMRDVIDGMAPAEKAHFIGYNGEVIPW